MPHTEALVTASIEQLRKLVAFKSISRQPNLPLIEYVEHYLKPLGFACARVPSPDGTKSNLLARVGEEKAGGIILSGHTDVVPVEGQAWDSDPFVITERGEKLFGRGTADMKSFLAVCLALAPELAKIKLDAPVYFAFSYDEEIGCLGVPYLLQHITQHAPKPAFALIGEPTEMQVVTAHKGVLSFETTVTGSEWHSSQPEYGVNAVHIACDLVNFLVAMNNECKAHGPTDLRFDPPHSTVHTGIIRGGTARNIIPKECFINWEIRPLPDDDPDRLVAKFQDYCKKHSAAKIVTQPASRMMGVTLPAHAAFHAQRIMRAANTNQGHAVSFGTEAGVFQDFDIPCIICGPGSIKQAHQPNEFIEISQIKACVEFMLRLIP